MITDTKMRYNEGRGKGEKQTQFLQYFRYTFCYFRTFLQETSVTVNEVICYVMIYLGVKTLRQLILDRQVESNGSSHRIPRIKTATMYT
jgi:hypothetical protein